MGPIASGQPHVPADWPPDESTLHFEQEDDGGDKIFLAGIATWMSTSVILLPAVKVKIEKLMYENRQQIARDF